MLLKSGEKKEMWVLVLEAMDAQGHEVTKGMIRFFGWELILTEGGKYFFR